MTGVALVATTGLAFAQTAPIEEPPEDGTESPERTVFSFGYDVDFQSLAWDISSPADEEDCSLSGTYSVTYGEDDDGNLTVESLAAAPADGEAVVVEVSDPWEEGDDPVPYGAGSDCRLQTVEVTGPNGQVNHGMFMKAFNEMWDGEGGRGCINRILAPSHLGKGDQQVRVSDVEAEGEEPAAMVGEIDFTSVDVDCEHGNGRDKEEKREKADKGGERGKSGEARGRNK